MVKNKNIRFFLKAVTRINFLSIDSYDKQFCIKSSRSLRIYFFCVKRQVKNDFPKDVERRVSVPTDRAEHIV